MHLRTTNTATCQTDSRYAFEFALPTGAVPLTNLRQVADAAARRDRFDIADLAEDFEVHRVELYQGQRPGEPRRDEYRPSRREIPACFAAESP